MNTFSYFLRHRARRPKRNTAQLAAQLAPAEEQLKGAEGTIQEAGRIIVSNELKQVPTEVLDSKGGGILGMEPLVLAIVVIMLAFIAFIAWQISLMPDAPG